MTISFLLLLLLSFVYVYNCFERGVSRGFTEYMHTYSDIHTDDTTRRDTHRHNASSCVSRHENCEMRRCMMHGEGRGGGNGLTGWLDGMAWGWWWTWRVDGWMAMRGGCRCALRLEPCTYDFYDFDELTKRSNKLSWFGSKRYCRRKKKGEGRITRKPLFKPFAFFFQLSLSGGSHINTYCKDMYVPYRHP